MQKLNANMLRQNVYSNKFYKQCEE